MVFICWVTFGILVPSHSSDLKLEIVASSSEKGDLNSLNVDYKVGSATNIILKPFSYGWILTSGWTGSSLAFEPNNTLHFCIDENGNVYPNDLVYLRVKKAKESTLDPNPQFRTKHLSITAKKYKNGSRYFRFCLVNVKNEGYVVSNLYSFSLNSDYEICDAKNITWSEMPEAAQKSMETLIIAKAKELKESFTPGMIIDQINHWKDNIHEKK